MRVVAHRLTELITEAVPNATIGLLVGSVLSRPDELVDDLDTIAFVEGGVGQKYIIGAYGLRNVECTTYDLDFPSLLTEEPSKAFVLIRELRRIYRGKSLFGDTHFEVLRTAFSARQLPVDPVRKILSELVPITVPRDGIDGWQSTLAALVAVESLLFCVGCLLNPDGPSKPKWYYFDAKALYPHLVLNALDELLEFLKIGGDQSGRINQLFLLCNWSWPPILQTLCRDAERLRSLEFFEAATLTFWMMAARVARSANFRLGISPQAVLLFEDAMNCVRERTKSCLLKWNEISLAQVGLLKILDTQPTFKLVI